MGDDLKTLPLRGTKGEQFRKLPAPLLGQIDADDVLRPSREERLTAAQAMKHVLRLVLMPRRPARR